MSKKTLHLYLRGSSATQQEEGASLDTQLEQGIQRSKKQGITVLVKERVF